MGEIAEFTRYLNSLRSAALWKLEGLEPWQMRWPMTPTGSNLLGILKHLGAMEYGYFGTALGREGEPLPFLGPDAEMHADLWVTQDETAESVIAFYRRAVAHSDESLADAHWDDPAHVPWWPQGEVTVGRILVHMLAEVARHVGQMDVLREHLDGRIGMSANNLNLPPADENSWAEHVEQVRDAAVVSSWPGARVVLYGSDLGQRDILVGAIETGEKTVDITLRAEHDASTVPYTGAIDVVVNSSGMPVLLTETTSVMVGRLADIDAATIAASGEAHAHWRAVMERRWNSPDALADMDDPSFVLNDDTPVVIKHIRVLEHLRGATMPA